MNTQGEWERRAQIHCSTTLSSAAGDLPDKFRKRGIDCAIHLNVDMIFKDMPTHIHMSAAGVVLISAAVAVKYTDRVLLLKYHSLRSTRAQSPSNSPTPSARLSTASPAAKKELAACGGV